MKQYDLVVLGSGPAGEKAALHAAYHGFKVAVVEKASALGGAGVNTGTLPSKTLKETALYLSGLQEHGRYGVERTFSHEPTAADFLFRERYVVKTGSEEFRLQLLRRKVDVYRGAGTFSDAHTIEVCGETTEMLSGKNILIATGSSPAHAAGMSSTPGASMTRTQFCRSTMCHRRFAWWVRASSVASMRPFLRRWVRG